MSKKKRQPAALPSASERPSDQQRFELKYWVPEARIAAVLAEIAPHVTLDPYYRQLGVSRQYNTSLYLDSADHLCFRRHDEEFLDRFKLRIRAYGDPPTGVSFFETKRKVGAATLKGRAMVPLADAAALIDGTYDTLPSLPAEQRRSLERFLYLKTIARAEPCVLVRAVREAYVSHDPMEDIRVTVDRSIAYQAAHSSTLVGDPRVWIPIDGTLQHGKTGPHVLMELKFPRIAPSWMNAVVRAFGLGRDGYSKFVAGVRHQLEQPFESACLAGATPHGRH